MRTGTDISQRQYVENLVAENIQFRAQVKQLDLDREAERHRRIEAEAKVKKMRPYLSHKVGCAAYYSAFRQSEDCSCGVEALRRGGEMK